MSTDTLETKTFTPVKNTLSAIRRTRRAYFGMHVAAFEQAQIGFKKARELTDGLFEELVTKGEILEAKAGVTLKGTQAKFLQSYSETSETVRDLLPSSGGRVEELEAEVEALNATLKSLKKTPTKKKTAAKKTAIKKTVARKTVAAKTAAPKTAKVEVTKTDLDDKYISYVEDVRGYDKDADAAIVKKIVDHCGIALRSRDGLFVACSDETERNTVRDSWLVKKLGIKGETSELDAKVMTVCETMQKDRMKSRVTFYYLAAKNEGKLSAL